MLYQLITLSLSLLKTKKNFKPTLQKDLFLNFQFL